MIRDSVLCNFVQPSLATIKLRLIEAADLIGRLEGVAKSSCPSLSCAVAAPAIPLEREIFQPSLPFANSTITSSPPLDVLDISPPAALFTLPSTPPPPPAPTFVPTKTSYGPIFEHTPVSPPSSAAHPVFNWIEERVNSFSEFVDTMWDDTRLAWIKEQVSEMGKRLDNLSGYILPFLLVLMGIMVLYSVFTMAQRIRRAATGGVDDVKEKVEGPDTPPKHRLQKLGTVLVSPFRHLVSYFLGLVIGFLRVVRSIRSFVLLSLASLLRRIAYMLPDDQAPATVAASPEVAPIPDPDSVPAPVATVEDHPSESTPPSVTPTPSPDSSSSRPSTVVLQSELEKRYGMAIMTAGARRPKPKALTKKPELGRELD
ncbi:hypothetical protein FRC02_011899 [Tulasnella sp. 418]|nr:hypothetical protein FRC02_011899 [Tulasnella sp. 418]